MSVDTMVQHATTTGGWLLSARLAWMIAAVWVVAVLAYAFVRSAGSAEPDPIRPSGPLF